MREGDGEREGMERGREGGGLSAAVGRCVERARESSFPCVCLCAAAALVDGVRGCGGRGWSVRAVRPHKGQVLTLALGDTPFSLPPPSLFISPARPFHSQAQHTPHGLPPMQALGLHIGELDGGRRVHRVRGGSRKRRERVEKRGKHTAYACKQHACASDSAPSDIPARSSRPSRAVTRRRHPGWDG